MPDILLVAATELELCDRRGLVCGVGPVEAAATTALGLLRSSHDAVLHIGVAGARGLTPGRLVVGTEAFYCDLVAEIPVVERVSPDATLLAAVKAAVPEAIALPIGTSAIVGGPCGSHPDVRVEAMEGFGVLRACALAGVPAVEVRGISNEIGEGDRSRWRMARGLDTIREALPTLVAALSA